MRHFQATFLAFVLALPVAGCGLQPMYSGGSNAAVAQGIAAVDVPPIPGRGGWLLRNALQERFGVAGQTTPAYRLDVRVDDALEALGVLNDDTISRERRILRTRYQLIDLATGEILLDATAGSDAGIDVVSSEYATIAAEQTALENLAKEVAERMAIQVALTLRERSQAKASGGS
ncbi:MAG: LPS assembly lipoprotein LptE [Pseudomonadota bacterium]